MESTKLSSKGQVIIPKHIRDSRHWDAGLELQVIEVENGILLMPKAPFMQTGIDDVAGCLPYKGERKSEAAIQAAMKNAARKAWRDSD